MFEIKPKWIKYLRRLRLECILADIRLFFTKMGNSREEYRDLQGL